VTSNAELPPQAVRNVRSLAVLMSLQGLANLAISALVLSKGVQPEPAGVWYFLNGPLALASGILALLAGGRTNRLESRSMGMAALILLGIAGVGTYKLPFGLLLSVAGVWTYLQQETKDAFARQGR
jgi:hypothetical protein